MIPSRARLRVHTYTHAHPGPHAHTLALVRRAQELFTLCFLFYLFYSLLRNRSVVSTRIGGGGGVKRPVLYSRSISSSKQFPNQLELPVWG